MRLVKIVYFKISEGRKDYFMKERSYIQGHNGKVIVDFITEETFDRNLEKGRRVEFVDIEKAPLPIRRAIEDYNNAVS